MPLDPKLTKFTTVTPISALYSFIQIVTKQGVAKFYPADSINPSYFLTSESDTNSQIGFKNNTAAVDIDCDVVIGEPMTIEGQAIISVPFWDAANAGGSTTAITIAIKKDDGSESIIVTSTKDCVIDSNEFKMMVFELTVPKTDLAIGDILRFTIAYPERLDANKTLRVFFDPSNLNITATILTTTTKVNIPVKIPF